MTLFQTVGPAVEPVTLAEVKTNLRIDHSSEDALISELIGAARQYVETVISIALINQTWRLCLDSLPAARIALLKCHPVRSVLSVTAFDGDGVATVITPADYQIDPHSRPARLRFTDTMPPIRCMNGLEIDFEAGFGETGADVPDTLKRAIHLLVARSYETRAAFGPENQPASIPDGFDRLIAPFRMPKL